VPEQGRPWRDYSLWSFLPPPAEATAAYIIPCNLRGLLLGFLPGLVNVVLGDLHLIGVPPRSRESIAGLDPDWKSLYLRTRKAGLVTEAAIHYATAPDEDEAYAADAFYGASSSWKYDVKLLLRYLGRTLFGGLLPRRAPAKVADVAAAEEGVSAVE
jgi:hypothetical protein